MNHEAVTGFLNMKGVSLLFAVDDCEGRSISYYQRVADGFLCFGSALKVFRFFERDGLVVIDKVKNVNSVRLTTNGRKVVFHLRNVVEFHRRGLYGD